jgi:sugar/nucleoside kinase (ribokinase family)
VEEDDYGVITGTVRSFIAGRALSFPKVLFFADSRSHILLFRNVIIKPNQFELLSIKNTSGVNEIERGDLLRALVRHRAVTCAPIFVTRGEKGILISDPEPTEVRGVKIQGPVDTTGAGDSATAGIVLMLVSGATMPEASLIGNLVASVTVQQLATCGTCSPEQLLSRLDLWLSQGE